MLHLRGLGLNMGMDYTVTWDEVNSDFERFDCHPEEDSNEAKCKARGCIWQVSEREREREREREKERENLSVCEHVCSKGEKSSRQGHPSVRTADFE